MINNNQNTANISTGDKMAIGVNVGLILYFTKDIIKGSIKYGAARASISASGAGQFITGTLSGVASQAGTVLSSSQILTNMATSVTTVSNAAATTGSAITSSQIVTSLATAATTVSNTAAATSSAIASSQAVTIAASAATAAAPAVIVGTATAVAVIGCYKLGSAAYESYQDKRREFLLSEIAIVSNDIAETKAEIAMLLLEKPNISEQIRKLEILLVEIKEVRASNAELNKKIQNARDEIQTINQQKSRATMSI